MLIFLIAVNIFDESVAIIIMKSTKKKTNESLFLNNINLPS